MRPNNVLDTRNANAFRNRVHIDDRIHMLEGLPMTHANKEALKGWAWIVAIYVICAFWLLT